jgi:ABC-type lipoprotein export system ATPase subunit
MPETGTGGPEIIKIIVRKEGLLEIMGPSGSGKSTFLPLSALLKRPRMKKIILDEKTSDPCLKNCFITHKRKNRFCYYLVTRFCKYTAVLCKEHP